MKWLKGQLGAILTSITLLIGMGVAYGHLDARQQELTFRQGELDRFLQHKVDRDVVLRELDQVHRDLANIQARLDGIIIRQAIIADR
jgi:hypothetical protein